MSKPDPWSTTSRARGLQHGRTTDRWPTWEAWSMEAMMVLPALVQRIETLETALRQLVDQIDAVHADPRYEAVWVSYTIRGGRYTEPTYTAELNAARAALAGEEAKL